MRDDSYSPYSSTPNRGTSQPANGGIALPPAAVRWICGLSAPLSFVVAGMCFYFLVAPFGQNPPPKEVALLVGIAAATFGLILVGIAAFYRGSPSAARAETELRLARPTEAEARWSPPAGGAGMEQMRALRPAPQEKTRRRPLRDLATVVAIVGILIGPALGYIAFQRQQVLHRGKPEPQTLRVADLGRNGPGDNIHVKITDFEIGDKYAARMRNGSWVGVCLPAFPKGKNGDPKALKVVIRSSRVHSEEELRDFCKQASVRGVVVNSIYEWENDREYMKSAYPGVDASSIWVVQEDYTFPNAGEIQTMYQISSGIVGLAVFCGIGMLMSKGS
jgi:hypothetical protein